MRRPAVLLVVVLLAGCGSHTGAPQVQSQPAHELLYVATATGMTIVDATTDAVVATLPLGTLLPDRSRYWSVQPGARTVIRAFDPTTGAETSAFDIAGSWSPPISYGPAPSGISRSGAWMVLTSSAGAHPATTSSFAVIDLAGRRLDRVITSAGDVSFDAVSDDGRNVYLVEHLAPSPHYVVRVASFQGNGLQNGVVGQIKTAEPEAMNGLYHTSVAVSGDWFLSLYTNPDRGPFIHALNTTQLFAQCILNMPDVPVALRPAWSMLLDGKRGLLYAVNGAGGVISEVDTTRLVVVRSSIDLAPAATTLTTTPLHAAALSVDGSRIYAAAERGLLVLYTGDLSVHARYATDRRVDSVAVSDDGQRLYVASAGAITRIEAATGRTLGTVSSAPTALGILGVGTR